MACATILRCPRRHNSLETARLRLRPLETADADALNVIQSDPHHMRFYPHPFSLQESREWIEKMHERYERDGFALLAVEDRETGEFLGNVGPIVQHVDDVGRGGARLVDQAGPRPPGHRDRGGGRVSRLGLRDVAGRPRDLADPAGQHAVARRRREPGDDRVEAGLWGTVKPEIHLVYRLDRPADGAVRGRAARGASRDRHADRSVTSASKWMPSTGSTRRGRADPAAGRRTRPSVLAAASRKAWLRRSDSRPASGDCPGPSRPGGRTGEGRPRGPPARVYGPESLVSATSASFIAPWAAWYAFTPGRNRSFVRQIDDHGVERCVRLQRDGQEGQPVEVRVRTARRTRWCGRSAPPRSRGCRRRAPAAGHPATGPSVRGAPPWRPRTPRCSSRRSRGPRSRYSAMSIRSITTSSTGLSCGPTGGFAIASTTS